MTFGYRSRFGRSGFRSPRGGRSSSFRGRGRGSDSYFASTRESYSDRSSFRGGSYRDSSYRSRDDGFNSHGSSGSRYSGDRYSSHGRKDYDINHHRESSSGSFGREYSRRSDGEPERKRMKPESGTSHKEGASPRRSYDLELSNRSYNSSSSPYRSESSSFGKSHRKEFSDFKKPLPPEQSFRRSSRGRVGSTSTTSRIARSSAPAFLKRAAVSRTSRLKPTVSRHLLLLRKKKQIRIMRMRREREAHSRTSTSGKDKIMKEDNLSDELEGDDEDMESEQNMEDDNVERSPTKSNSDKKEIKKVVKKDSHSSPEKSSSQSESSKMKEKNRTSPVRGLYRDHIPLKCIHCKMECKTFKVYQHHLTTLKHKVAMEKLLDSMKQKLRRMRTEQREQQRIIDEESDNFNRTSYCKLCKLNYKQTRQEHYTSDFHISMNEFLNSRCSICRISFNTPILYEHHRCTLTHIKRKAFLERRGIDLRGDDDENNEEENFMVLDSVGSADESNEETEEVDEDGKAVTGKKKVAAETKKKLQKITGGEYVKKVSVYYCRLCKLCLHYNPNKNPEDYVLSHCRTRFHLKRYSLEKSEKSSTESPKKTKKREQVDDSANMSDDLETEENNQFSDDAHSSGENNKMSEDEDDSQSSNRYDRFGTSEEKDSVDKQNAGNENADDQNNKSGNTAVEIKVESK